MGILELDGTGWNGISEDAFAAGVLIAWNDLWIPHFCHEWDDANDTHGLGLGLGFARRYMKP